LFDSETARCRRVSVEPTFDAVVDIFGTPNFWFWEASVAEKIFIDRKWRVDKVKRQPEAFGVVKGQIGGVVRTVYYLIGDGDHAAAVAKMTPEAHLELKLMMERKWPLSRDGRVVPIKRLKAFLRQDEEAFRLLSANLPPFIQAAFPDSLSVATPCDASQYGVFYEQMAKSNKIDISMAIEWSGRLVDDDGDENEVVGVRASTSGGGDDDPSASVGGCAGGGGGIDLSTSVGAKKADGSTWIGRRCKVRSWSLSPEVSSSSSSLSSSLSSPTKENTECHESLKRMRENEIEGLIQQGGAQLSLVAERDGGLVVYPVSSQIPAAGSLVTTSATLQYRASVTKVLAEVAAGLATQEEFTTALGKQYKAGYENRDLRRRNLAAYQAGVHDGVEACITATEISFRRNLPLLRVAPGISGATYDAVVNLLCMEDNAERDKRAADDERRNGKKPRREPRRIVRLFGTQVVAAVKEQSKALTVPNSTPNSKADIEKLPKGFWLGALGQLKGELKKEGEKAAEAEKKEESGERLGAVALSDIVKMQEEMTKESELKTGNLPSEIKTLFCSEVGIELPVPIPQRLTKSMVVVVPPNAQYGSSEVVVVQTRCPGLPSSRTVKDAQNDLLDGEQKKNPGAYTWTIPQLKALKKVPDVILADKNLLLLAMRQAGVNGVKRDDKDYWEKVTDTPFIQPPPAATIASSSSSSSSPSLSSAVAPTRRIPTTLRARHPHWGSRYDLEKMYRRLDSGDLECRHKDVFGLLRTDEELMAAARNGRTDIGKEISVKLPSGLTIVLRVVCERSAFLGDLVGQLDAGLLKKPKDPDVAVKVNLIRWKDGTQANKSGLIASAARQEQGNGLHGDECPTACTSPFFSLVSPHTAETAEVHDALNIIEVLQQGRMVALIHLKTSDGEPFGIIDVSGHGLTAGDSHAHQARRGHKMAGKQTCVICPRLVDDWWDTLVRRNDNDDMRLCDSMGFYARGDLEGAAGVGLKAMAAVLMDDPETDLALRALEDAYDGTDWLLHHKQGLVKIYVVWGIINANHLSDKNKELLRRVFEEKTGYRTWVEFMDAKRWWYTALCFNDIFVDSALGFEIYYVLEFSLICHAVVEMVVLAAYDEGEHEGNKRPLCIAMHGHAVVLALLVMDMKARGIFAEDSNMSLYLHQFTRHFPFEFESRVLAPFISELFEGMFGAAKRTVRNMTDKKEISIPIIVQNVARKTYNYRFGGRRLTAEALASTKMEKHRVGEPVCNVVVPPALVKKYNTELRLYIADVTKYSTLTPPLVVGTDIVFEGDSSLVFNVNGTSSKKMSHLASKLGSYPSPKPPEPKLKEYKTMALPDYNQLRAWHFAGGSAIDKMKPEMVQGCLWRFSEDAVEAGGKKISVSGNKAEITRRLKEVLKKKYGEIDANDPMFEYLQSVQGGTAGAAAEGTAPPLEEPATTPEHGTAGAAEEETVPPLEEPATTPEAEQAAATAQPIITQGPTLIFSRQELLANLDKDVVARDLAWRVLEMSPDPDAKEWVPDCPKRGCTAKGDVPDFFDYSIVRHSVEVRI
jgi:hypothetical protein